MKEVTAEIMVEAINKQVDLFHKKFVPPVYVVMDLKMFETLVSYDQREKQDYELDLFVDNLNKFYTRLFNLKIIISYAGDQKVPIVRTNSSIEWLMKTYVGEVRDAFYEWVREKLF